MTVTKFIDLMTTSSDVPKLDLTTQWIIVAIRSDGELVMLSHSQDLVNFEVITPMSDEYSDNILIREKNIVLGGYI